MQRYLLPTLTVLAVCVSNADAGKYYHRRGDSASSLTLGTIVFPNAVIDGRSYGISTYERRIAVVNPHLSAPLMASPLSVRSLTYGTNVWVVGPQTWTPAAIGSLEARTTAIRKAADASRIKVTNDEIECRLKRLESRLKPYMTATCP